MGERALVNRVRMPASLSARVVRWGHACSARESSTGANQGITTH